MLHRNRVGAKSYRTTTGKGQYPLSRAKRCQPLGKRGSLNLREGRSETDLGQLSVFRHEQGPAPSFHRAHFRT